MNAFNSDDSYLISILRNNLTTDRFFILKNEYTAKVPIPHDYNINMWCVTYSVYIDDRGDDIFVENFDLTNGIPSDVFKYPTALYIFRVSEIDIVSYVPFDGRIVHVSYLDELPKIHC